MHTVIALFDPSLFSTGSCNYSNSCFCLRFRDSIIFACVNSGTSFYGGFVIFSVLGFMAQKQGVEVKDVAKGGKKMPARVNAIFIINDNNNNTNNYNNNSNNYHEKDRQRRLPLAVLFTMFSGNTAERPSQGKIGESLVPFALVTIHDCIYVLKNNFTSGPKS